jgi:hypothetical protein
MKRMIHHWADKEKARTGLLDSRRRCHFLTFSLSLYTKDLLVRGENTIPLELVVS